MKETQGSDNISTKLQRIAKLAKEAPTVSFTTLAHNIDLEFLREAYRQTRKDGAVGIDGVDAETYEQELDSNLSRLLESFKSGKYKAPPVRRVHIPKGDGTKTRPIGIPTFEDKILQRAVLMVLEAIYEQDFLDCSYGFRKNRSQHQALEALWKRLVRTGGAWVLEVDLQDFFNTLRYEHLRSFLDFRVRDGVIRRMIDKWLKAGVMEEGELRFPESGTPQGGVISPLLANIYLHEVIDRWFHDIVQPMLGGEAHLIRFADDFVIVFARERDARRVWQVLPQRVERYGLSVHPEKTRLIHFTPPDGGGGGTFDFLGFTHHWGKSRKGNWTVVRRTANDRFTRSLKRIAEWCAEHRHDHLREQAAQLKRKVVGHYNYYGITGNHQALQRFRFAVESIWLHWLRRRSHKHRLPWVVFKLLLERYPLPRPRVVKSMLTAPAKP